MAAPNDLRQRVRARLAEQRVLVRRLLALREQLQGSLFARYGACGKETCACRRGSLHGPYYVFTRRIEGRGAFAYVETEKVAAARDLVARYKEFQAGVRRLRRLNEDIVKLLKQYQRTATRRAGARLGLAS